MNSEIRKKIEDEAKRYSSGFINVNIQPSNLNSFIAGAEFHASLLSNEDSGMRWVSVKERLPDYDEYVLWLHDSGAMFVADIDHDNDWRNFQKMYSIPEFPDPITHWMPLPDVSDIGVGNIDQSPSQPKEQPLTPYVAKQLLLIRDALIHDDCKEAYHNLYLIVSPYMDKMSNEVWTEIESLSESSPLTPAPESKIDVEKLAIKNAKVRHTEPVKDDYEDDEKFQMDFGAWEFMVDESKESFIDGYKAKQTTDQFFIKKEIRDNISSAIISRSSQYLDVYNADELINKVMSIIIEFTSGFVDNEQQVTKPSQNPLPVDWDAIETLFYVTFTGIHPSVRYDIFDWFRTNIKTNSPGGYTLEKLLKRAKDFLMIYHQKDWRNTLPEFPGDVKKLIDEILALKTNSQGGYSEEDMRKCFEAGVEYQKQFESKLSESYDKPNFEDYISSPTK